MKQPAPFFTEELTSDRRLSCGWRMQPRSHTWSRWRARAAWSWRCAAAGTAPPVTASPRAASCSTCRTCAALQIDVEGRTAWAETGLTAGEYTTAAGGLRPGDRVRRHRLGRDWRDHAGRRRRLSGAEVRPDHRSPAGRGCGDCRRASCCTPMPRITRTCSGRCAAAAATSAWPPASSTACIRSTQWWAGC